LLAIAGRPPSRWPP